MTNTMATQFKQRETPSGKKAVEAFSAVWFFCGEEVFIGAATLEALRTAWKRIVTVGPELDESRVQHVFIVSASNEAPSVAPAPAYVKCNRCKDEASFIIGRLPYCARHKP